jgi:hypothetical protein
MHAAAEMSGVDVRSTELFRIVLRAFEPIVSQSLETYRYWTLRRQMIMATQNAKNSTATIDSLVTTVRSIYGIAPQSIQDDLVRMADDMDETAATIEATIGVRSRLRSLLFRKHIDALVSALHQLASKSRVAAIEFRKASLRLVDPKGRTRILAHRLTSEEEAAVDEVDEEGSSLLDEWLPSTGKTPAHTN